ncbi:hypothetical protein MHB43_23685 [Paenibacillus sp. FSL H8-0317]|uniref:hypothetical protein n=1 Tax=Paenibacillus sp. FSL H8-0317 TaxID=2921385 RepID=UPI0032569C97
MQPELKQIADINEADFIELLSGETDDFSKGKIYEVEVDTQGLIFTEDEHFVYDDLHIPNTEFFYNPQLEIRSYKKISE